MPAAFSWYRRSNWATRSLEDGADPLVQQRRKRAAGRQSVACEHRASQQHGSFLLGGGHACVAETQSAEPTDERGRAAV